MTRCRGACPAPLQAGSRSLRARSQTARVKRPVLILGSPDGIETGVRQLIRTAPLETRDLSYLGHSIRVPSEAEILRIKGGELMVSRVRTGHQSWPECRLPLRRDWSPAILLLARHANCISAISSAINFSAGRARARGAPWPAQYAP